MALALFSVQDAITRTLVQDLPVVQILTARFTAFAVFALIFTGWRVGLRTAFATGAPVLQIARSVLIIVEIGLFALGLRTIGLAEVHAIFSLFPLLVTAFAGPLLGEAIGWRRWLAVCAGFAGTLIILRPGGGVFHSAMLYPLAAAFLWALYSIFTRKVSRTDSFETSLVYTALVAAALVTPFGLAAWTQPATEQWLLLAFIAVTSIVSHLLLILALERVEAATLQPFNYLLLVFATIMGFAVFGELPDWWTIAGASIVVFSGLFVIWRERQLIRRNRISQPLPRRPG